jgi:hypothetical protein
MNDGSTKTDEICNILNAEVVNLQKVVDVVIFAETCTEGGG